MTLKVRRLTLIVHIIYRYVYVRKDCMACAKINDYFYCMSIAKEVIEAHAGEIRVESAVGKGTTINIRLT